MIKQLSTIEDVISELGGPKAVAKLTQRGSSSAVPMWKMRRSFPAKTYVVMKSALEAKGLSAPDSLWNMSSNMEKTP